LPGSTWRTALFFGQVLALKSLGVRLVWTVHNLVNHERRHEALEIGACRLLARLVDAVIVHCDAAARRVSEAYRISGDSIHVVPHGRYGGWYGSPPGRSEARDALAIAPDCGTVFLHFGQIRPYKGIDRLLTAFRSLPADDALLLVVGEARYPWLAEELERLAAADERVRLELDFVSDQRLLLYLAACDAVVLPYTSSLTSGSAVLAAGYGRPIIAPDLGCLSEFPEGSALLYRADDPRGLASAMASARSAPLDEMGLRARNHVDRHTWDAVGQTTAEIYHRVVERRGKPTATTRDARR